MWIYYLLIFTDYVSLPLLYRYLSALWLLSCLGVALLTSAPRPPEQASGKRFEEWLHSGEEAVLSPCRYATFTEDQPPPLYIDLGSRPPPPLHHQQRLKLPLVELTTISHAGEEGHKPKWTLAHGAGT